MSLLRNRAPLRPGQETSPRRRRGRALIAGVAAFAALLAPAAADALAIKSATVTLSAAKGDGFTIKGEFESLAFDAATVVTFELDRSVSGFRMSELTRRKNRITYKAPRGTPGLVQLVIDLKKRRFSAKAVGLLFTGLPNPLVVRLGTDAARECAVVGFEDKAASRLRGKPPKTTHLSLPRRAHGNPCLVLGSPTADPPAVVVDVPTNVRFEATLATGAALDPGTLRLLRLDAAGAVLGAALCTLTDDGGTASGDVLAGDGTHTCTSMVAEDAVGTLRFVVDGTAGGVSIRSQSMTVPVVAPLTDADLATLLDVQAQARSLWEEQAAALGDTANARHETVRRLAALPGVAEAALSPNGVDIALRYSSGHLGGLMLSPRFGEVDPASITSAAVVDLSADPGTARRDTIASAASTCPPAPTRTLIGTRKAILLKTSYFGPADDWQLAKAALEGSCLPFGTVPVHDLTIAELLTITQYDTVVLSTHGFVGPDGRVAIVTDEPADSVSLEQYRQRFAAHQLYVVGLPAGILGGGRDVFVVTPLLITNLPGQFDHALIHASHCWSAFNPSEAAAFLGKGAKTFFGFDNLVSNRFARITTRAVLEDVAQNLFTTGNAFARAVKVDPTPSGGNPLAKGLWRLRPAPARLVMTGDPQLAYVGAPELAPAHTELGPGGEQSLTTTVERSEDCELEYLWGLLGNGTLTDADGNQAPPAFDGIRASARFISDPSGLGGDNDVTVGVRPPPRDDGSKRPIFGSGCAAVVVRDCGDGARQGGEECDGGDATACPGNCRNDCTCARCGDGLLDAGEICDGDTKPICDAVSSPRVGYCRPDCHSCAVCGDHVVDPNEECELTDDSACPGACRSDCTCGCAPGDPNGCPATLCCNPQTKACCTPIQNGIDPVCPFDFRGCCGDIDLAPCGPPGQSPPPIQCPAPDCDQSEYYCQWCDNKLIEGFYP